MSDTRSIIEELDKLIDSGEFDKLTQIETLQRMRNRLVSREVAAEKIATFRAEFEKTCWLFSDALTALSMTDGYASMVDMKIAKDIDERLRYIDALCRQTDFGYDHHFIED